MPFGVCRIGLGHIGNTWSERYEHKKVEDWKVKGSVDSADESNYQSCYALTHLMLDAWYHGSEDGCATMHLTTMARALTFWSQGHRTVARVCGRQAAKATDYARYLCYQIDII
jgi:hypothetical protein